MESLKLSFESVMPVFLLMLLGYVLRSAKVTGKEVFDGINKLIFKIFLPILLFSNIYKTEIKAVLDLRLIAIVIITILCIFIVGYFAVLFITDDNAKRGVILQAFFRSNYAMIGVPLADYICRGKGTGIASMLVAFVIPMYNVLAVIALERFRDGNVNVKKMLKGIAKNPLVIGCLTGLLFATFKITLPSFLATAVNDASKIASPLAMVVLGASFTFSGVKGYLREIVISVSARLVITPFIAVGVATLLGVRGEALVSVLLLSGSPVAVSSFAMSQQMGGDENLAAQNVVISSAFCLLTLFVWIFALSSLGLF